MQDYYLGLDVGGTKTEACLVELGRSSDFHSYRVVNRERMSTGRTTSLTDFLKRSNELISGVLKASNLNINQLKGVGFGLPGSISPSTHLMGAGSIPFFLNTPLIQPFREAIGYQGPLVFDNDANCFALAEAYFGAGGSWAKQNHILVDDLCMIGLIVGTGVGGGLIVNGDLVRGRRGGAGEVGHISLVDGGRSCYCGKFGCAEQYLSGPAFELSYAERSPKTGPLKGSEIFKLVAEGDPVAVATLASYKEYLVKFLSNLSNCFDPHVIVLGGGMSSQPAIYEGIRDGLSQGCFLTADPPFVLPYECGASAGVIGAALLSFAKHTIGREGTV